MAKFTRYRYELWQGDKAYFSFWSCGNVTDMAAQAKAVMGEFFVDGTDKLRAFARVPNEVKIVDESGSQLASWSLAQEFLARWCAIA